MIHKFGPVVYFHPKEKYFPESVEEYTEKSYVECYKDRNAKKHEVTYKNDHPTLETLGELSRTQPDHGHHCRVILKDKKKGFPGKELGIGGTILAPAYVNVYEANPNYYILQFTYFYAYNGPTVSLGKITIGTHEGDWERTDVHVVRNAQGKFVLKRVHYGAHGQFGHMYEMHQFDLSGTHPVVYAALYGHASLVKQTKLDSKLDSTKKSRYVWNCGDHYVIVAVNGIAVPGQEWLDFRGPFGQTQEGKNSITNNSPSGPSDATWWRTKNRPTRNMIADLKGYPYLPIKNEKGHGTRSFTYNGPSSLSPYFCLEFFKQNADKYGQKNGAQDFEQVDQEMPPFKIIQRQLRGLQKKTLYRSEQARALEKSRKSYKYCFKRPKQKQVNNVKFVWTTKEVPSDNLGLGLKGFEFLGEDEERE